MKVVNLPVALCSLLAVAMPAVGQDRGPRPRVVPPPSPPVPAVHESVADLPHNVTLTLEGPLFGTYPTDFSITTGGPRVATDLPLDLKSAAPVIGTFEAVLVPGEPWQVHVSLGARIPIPLGPSNYEYRDLQLGATVRIAPGKRVILWQKGDQKLILSMEKAEE